MGNGSMYQRVKSICTGLAVAFLLCGCSQEAVQENIVVVEQGNEEITYDFGVAQIGNVTKTEKVRCTYRQMKEQEVSFPMSGRLVDRVYVEKGDSVKKGDLLVELSSEDLERQIEELEYRIARNELLLGYTDTNEANDISGLWVNYLYYSGMTESDKENLDEQIENLQRNYRYQREDYSDALNADRKELEQLSEELKSSRIYAQMDGVVYSLKENLEGATAQLGEVVMTVIDTSECLFETNVPELAGYFEEGQRIEMSLSYGATKGVYVLTPWHMDEWGDVQLFMVYDEPEGVNLEVGASGTMQIVTGSRENVLCVPLRAVHNAEDKRYVYVMGADNMREVRWVETGLYGDETVEILSGLEEGEKVIQR